MSEAAVTVVDYGLGNLYSVQRALEVCGVGSIKTSSNPEDIVTAERVILPGVGAFADGMEGLRERNLDNAVKTFVKTGRPLLGICLGMQLFASESAEFGKHRGLDLIPGRVVPIPTQSASGERIKSPYIGWSSLAYPSLANERAGLLSQLATSDSVYLVHSFHFVPEVETDLLATYCYGGYDVTAAVRHDNITGLQFHPEKSGRVGLSILSNFLRSEH